jgi:hypothetical protein
MFLTPSATPVPTSEGLCNCLSSDTDIFLSLTVATDSRIPIREDAVTANAIVLVAPKRYCLSATTCESRRVKMHAGLMRVNKYLRGSPTAYRRSGSC